MIDNYKAVPKWGEYDWTTWDGSPRDKLCPHCGIVKSAPADFYFRKRTTAAGVMYRYPSSRCKDCTKATTLKWYNNNHEQARERARKSRRERPDLHKDRHLRATYGITLEEWEKMRDAQDGGCKICRRVLEPDSRGRTLMVDHCHSSGAVRGLLCVGCNRGLGFYEDDPARLRAAADYLEEARR